MFKRQNLPGHRDRTSPHRIQRTTLEAEALRLRARGYCLNEIALLLSSSGSRQLTGEKVGYIITAALERKGKPEANQVRADLYERMDRAYNMAMRIAAKGGPDAVAALNAATGIAARMAALSGADAPKTLDVKDDRVLPPDAATRTKFLERLARKVVPGEPDGG